MTKKKEPKVKERRQSRVPLGTPRRKLAWDDQDPNYHYRWINDSERRLLDAQDGGYEFVVKESDDDHAGDQDLSNEESGVGTMINKTVNSNGRRAYLMRIKKEWFEEDRAEKEAKVDEIERQLKTGTNAEAQKLEKPFFPDGRTEALTFD